MGAMVSPNIFCYLLITSYNKLNFHLPDNAFQALTELELELSECEAYVMCLLYFLKIFV